MKAEETLQQLKTLFGHIGEEVFIHADSTFDYPENIHIADHVYIGPEAYIWAVGGLEIGENVIIGPRVNIHTSNHRYDGATMLPYDDVSYLEPVRIEKNVWIGANVLICPGITIGEGSVIALGAVVTKDVPKGAVVGGNPARVIKMRDMAHYEKLDREGRHYLKLKNAGKINPIFIRRPPAPGNEEP